LTGREAQVTVDLSLRKIRSFMIVAELRSFRRAAEQIHISPPALSTHIRELEETIGVPLLHRTTRNVELTEEGARFLERIRPLFSGLDAVIEEFREEADLLRGRISIACLPSIVSHVLPPMIVTLKERHPGIALRVLDLGYSAMIGAIKSGEADLGIGPIPENDSAFDVEPLIEDGFVALVPVGHPLAGKRSVSMDELARFPFIGRKVGTSIRDALDRAVAASGTKLNIAHELVYHHSVGSMVQAGLGVTALPSMSLPTLNFPNAVAIPISSPRLARRIGVIRRKGGGISPAVREFLAMLSERVGILSGTPA
jgi:DNA-binding transcriptional LysR family regulator